MKKILVVSRNKLKYKKKGCLYIKGSHQLISALETGGYYAHQKADNYIYSVSNHYDEIISDRELRVSGKCKLKVNKGVAK